MSDAGTRKMLRMYSDRAGAPGFLASKFQSPPENYHSGEEVEIDIRRNGAKVAIVVTDISAPGNKNESTRYVNKTYKPPVYKEEATLSAYDLIKRQAGQLPFTDPDFRANVVETVFRVTGDMEAMIRRGIELQASQVLQTGTLTLKDENGVNRFTLSFSPKATHFPTVANDWNGGSATPLLDLENLAVVVRRDGKRQPGMLSFGRLAWQDFLSDSEVQARLDNTRMNLGRIEPRRRSEDATFQGMIQLGNYEFEMWTYDGFYEDPQSSSDAPYIVDDNVIMTSPGARLDLTFGAIPVIPGAASQQALQYVPSRLSDGERGIDLSTHAYFSEDGTNLIVRVGARPLCIPTAIDTFGCLNTRA
jgi:hypothetical protein